MPTISLYSSKATYLRSGTYAYSNYGSYDYLRCGTSADATSGGYRTLLYFDLTSIPSNNITSATLYMYSYSNGCYRAGISFFVYPLTQDWSQDVATFNSMSSKYTTSYEGGGERWGDYDTWYSYNVTSVVQAQKNGSITNYGLMVKQNSTALEVSKCFNKSGTYAPYLLVTYVGSNRTLSLTAGANIGSVSGGGTIEAGTTATAVATPGSYTGYTTTFEKWVLTSTGSTLSTNSSYSFTMPDYDYALTASATKTPINYSLSLALGTPSYINYATLSPSGSTFAYGSSITLGCVLNSITGYTTVFNQWVSSNTGLLPSSVNQTYIFNMPAGNITLTAYAIRTANTYSLIFNSNGGTGTMNSQTMTYDVSSNISSNTFLRTGYSFTGWATSSGGAVVYTNSQSVSNLSSINGATINLFAVWSLNTYTVSVIPNNSSYGSATRIGTDSLNYLSPVSISCSVTTLNGYTTSFINWTSNSNGSFVNSNIVETTYYMSDSNTILTANFVRIANNYTVSFNYGVGSGETNTKVVTYGSSYGILPTGYKLGYTFLGWSTTEQTLYTSTEVPVESRIDLNTTVGIYTDHTLYAWYHEDTRVWSYNTENSTATSRCLYRKTSYSEGVWLFAGNYDPETETYILF